LLILDVHISVDDPAGASSHAAAGGAFKKRQ